MKFKLYNSDGASFDEVEFSNFPVFEGDEGLPALKDALVAYMANVRQGNACVKTRAEVSGTGKKPWRQKGTGHARHGSKRSPIWVGGGVAHGPKPRDFSQKLNKKVKNLAFGRALFDSAENGALALIKDFNLEQPKTAILNAIVEKISAEGTILFVDAFFTQNAVLAARNNKRIFMIDADSLNAWDLVRHDFVLIAQESMERILSRLGADK